MSAPEFAHEADAAATFSAESGYMATGTPERGSGYEADANVLLTANSTIQARLNAAA